MVLVESIQPTIPQPQTVLSKNHYNFVSKPKKKKKKKKTAQSWSHQHATVVRLSIRQSMTSLTTAHRDCTKQNKTKQNKTKKLSSLAIAEQDNEKRQAREATNGPGRNELLEERRGSVVGGVGVGIGRRRAIRIGIALRRRRSRL
jgi:hypothetical protein